MSLSYLMRTFDFGDGLTYAGQDLRLFAGTYVSALGGASGNQLAIGPGVRPSVANPLGVAPSSGLSITINPGLASIQSASVNGGAYTVVLDSPQTLTCSAANGTYARIDSVCITVTDNGNSSSTVVLQIVTGTPSATPVAPTLPADSLLLCNVTVPASATTLTSGNLADERTYMAGAGGITQVQSSAFYPTVGPAGALLYDMNLGRYRMFNGGSVQSPKTVTFTTGFDGPHTVNGSSTPATVASASVSPDGTTNVEISFTYSYISSAGTSSGNACTLAFNRGGTSLRFITKTCSGPDANIDGGTITIVDELPAAGTYAYNVTIENQGTGTFGVQNGLIVVKALPL